MGVQEPEVIVLQDTYDVYLKVEKKEKEIDRTSQINIKAEHYENFGPTLKEITETEKMIREDRKNELKKLAFNQHLYQETYYLMNKQFEREINNNPPKDIEKRIYQNKPEDYPNALIINEHVNWEESGNNLHNRPYNAALHNVEDDFGIRYHFNQIWSVKTSDNIIENVNTDN
jgi:hypothetical protein